MYRIKLSNRSSNEPSSWNLQWFNICLGPCHGLNQSKVIIKSAHETNLWDEHPKLSFQNQDTSDFLLNSCLFLHDIMLHWPVHRSLRASWCQPAAAHTQSPPPSDLSWHSWRKQHRQRYSKDSTWYMLSGSTGYMGTQLPVPFPVSVSYIVVAHQPLLSYGPVAFIIETTPLSYHEISKAQQ